MIELVILVVSLINLGILLCGVRGEMIELAILVVSLINLGILLCGVREYIDHCNKKETFPTIHCGYLGGCGSRMNGKCELTEKCERWEPMK